MKSAAAKLAILFFSVLFVLGALKLAQDRLPFSVADMLKKESPHRLQYLKYDEIFGNEKAFSVLFEREGEPVTDAEVFQFLKSIYYELETNKSVGSLGSIKNSEYVKFEKYHVFLNLFYNEDGSLKEEAKNHLAHPFWKDTLLTSDGQNFLVVGSLSDAALEKDERFAVARLEESLRKIEQNHPQWRTHLIGTKVVQYYLFQDIVLTQKFITPILLGLLGLLIFLLFRSGTILWMTLTTLMLSYASTIYFVYSIDSGISAFTGFAIFFVLIIGTSDLVHFFSSFIRIREYNLGKKIEMVKKAIFRPCLFTSITTVIGFSSLLVSELLPVVKIGLYSSFGSLICFFFTFYVLPRFLHIFNFNIYKPEVLAKLDIRRPVSWAMANAKVSLAIAILISGVFVYNISGLNIDDRFYNKLADSHRLSVAVDKFSKHFQFLDTIEMVYRPKDGEPLSRRNYEIFKKFEHEVVQNKDLSSIKSHASFYNYVSERAIADLTPLGIKPHRIEARIDSFYDKVVEIGVLDDFYSEETGQVRAIAYLESPSFQTVKSVRSKIQQVWEAKYQEFFDIEFMGHAYIRAFVNEGIIRGILKSLLVGLCFTFLAFLAIFRNFRICVLAMLPNILPLLFIGGFMGMLNVDVESNLVLLVCITLGVSVDDTIHFIHALMRHKKRFARIEDAVLHTLNDTSGALVGTTMVFLLSFPCFFLAELKIYVQAGIYVILSLLVALLADLLLLPVILKLSSQDRGTLVGASSLSSSQRPLSQGEDESSVPEWPYHADTNAKGSQPEYF